MRFVALERNNAFSGDDFEESGLEAGADHAPIDANRHRSVWGGLGGPIVLCSAKQAVLFFAEGLFNPGGGGLQVMTNGFRVQRSRHQKDILEQINHLGVGNQRSPFRFQVEQFGAGSTLEPVRVGPERFGFGQLTRAALSTPYSAPRPGRIRC